MAEAKERAAWGRAAMVACLIAETNRDEKKKSEPFTPDDFNPYADNTDRANNDDRMELSNEQVFELMKKMWT